MFVIFLFLLTTQNAKIVKYELLFVSVKKQFHGINDVRVLKVIDSAKHCKYRPSSAFVS